MNVLVAFVTAFYFANGSQALTVNQLHRKYYEIFSRAYNRNAASHLWASYILNRAANLTESDIYQLFSGFCPVSGSPVNPSSHNLWQGVGVKNATDTTSTVSGNIHVCCWPCVCDLQALVKTDSLTIRTSDGRKHFNALVIGDPCIQPNSIPSQAPEVYCRNGELVGATKSNNGYIVIGMLQSEPLQTIRGYYEASMISNRCENRANQGYRSGMGRIFVQVASINPIS